ncbi:carbohydrate ABC transporter permease [Microbacterium sp. AISO3]|jgi:raffinose/stachyose/melibiose transport system permease protein|uniref:Raffinose/stachyose/melibiose transport system permease protein n=1 Tax=Microbacterium paludicola TaxID=300019 RepID=A0ABU1I1Q1_9MICO|nr:MULTISPECIES: carbohydrate ABC transporter permease [Microbacterium]APF34760.1 ABC transporter permease [Microbacterium paludicola]MDR6167811.1 raffinose/stachyose/melibiose transport system permease protein [Microbacterium paludicola]OWP23600.1 carbohydrate ABC transporter permease [Microbacterium sp. AISO3]POX66084.1 carbohydrate ABC transporter permease [Microbacterium sp. Ru50]
MSTSQPALVFEQADAVTVDARRRARPSRTSRAGKGERVNWSATVILILCAVTVLLPLYVTISMAFKTTGQAVDGNAFSLPAPFSIDGFVQAWNLTRFPVGAAISFFVTAGTVVATIILAAFASYAIVRNWDRRLFRYSFFYLLAAMFIPFPVVALPQIQLTGRLGLDNPVGVVLLATMFQLSFSVLLFTAFLRSIPIELEESARIDGASTWQTFWKLIFPLLAPMSATVGIFAFLYAWNDFMLPSLIISDPAMQTLPVRQNLFQTQFSNNYNVSFASYLMAMAPAILAYLFTQRWVMEGVTQGAVKG